MFIMESAKKANIACVIVTYNRKNYLKRCLEAVDKQTLKPQSVYVVDNASTDGTIDSVKEWGFYECKRNGITYKYVLNKKNEGGAGGFHLGMKTAFNDGIYDGFWVMDDDGEPDNECLKELVRFLPNRDYIAPMVLSDVDRKTCSFIPSKKYEDVCRQADSCGVIENWASPFNGILYSRNLVEKIGFPKKEMFIWGDEINYQIRAEKAGFSRMTNIKAVHYHPVDRQVNICNEDTLHEYVVVVNSDWKLYCLLRNQAYNRTLLYNRYRAYRKNLLMLKAYKHYYHHILADFTKDKLMRNAVFAGTIGYFGGLKKYIKN